MSVQDLEGTFSSNKFISLPLFFEFLLSYFEDDEVVAFAARTMRIF